VSRQIHDIFQRYTPLVEPLSLDEAFLDVRGSVGLFGPPETIGRKIKGEIRAELGLVASVGVAPNKFLAKVASDLEKPDGFVVVPADSIQAFLDPLPVGRLWGVGRVFDSQLAEMGIRTVAQLRRLSPAILGERFGSAGRQLMELAQGVDNRAVVPDHQAKSISHETTFESDVSDPEILRAWLLDLTEQVARRLRAEGYRGRTVHLKVRFAPFRTITRSQTLLEPTSATEELWRTAAAMLAGRLPKNHSPVRLLGMGVGGLDASGQVQAQLFDDRERQRQRRLDAVTDRIKDRYGARSIGRAGGIRSPHREDE
jgi:DNA polymerase-4